MKSKRNLLIAALLLIALSPAVDFSPAPTLAQDIVYEVRPQTAVPYGYTAEPSRLINIIERLIVENQQDTSRHLQRVEATLGRLAGQLNSIDKNIADLSERIARIETKLGIKPIAPKTEPSADLLDWPGIKNESKKKD